MNDTKVVRPDEAPMTWADKTVAWIYYGPSNYVRGQMSRNVTLDRSVALSKEYSGARLEPLVTHADYKALEDELAALRGKVRDLVEAGNFARDVLAELYAKYQIKVGPFASQAQVANGKLRLALEALS